MLKVLPIISALFTIGTMWGQNCASCGLEAVDVEAGQTVRLSVAAASSQSCAAELGFLDSHGQSIGPSSRVSLAAGQSTILELPSTGQRAEILPQIVTDPGATPSACRATATVLDEPSDPPGGGIKVHGHWIIDLRNPDGTLATHREFENSLVASGAATLVGVLAHQMVTGTWNIQLQGSVCSGVLCYIYENLDTNATGPNVYNGLTVSAPTSGAYNGDLLLSGSFIAPTSGTIGAVSTYVNTCLPVWTPASCTYGSTLLPAIDTNFTFTFQNIAVIAGQLVDVTVVISFL